MKGDSDWRHSLVSNCVIRGNISSNDSSATGGGGVSLRAGSLVDCVISGNADMSPVGNAMGGGVAVYQPDAYPWLISGCSIIENEAYDGGGLHINSALPRAILDTHVDRNTSHRYGGGIYAASQLLFMGGSVNSNASRSYYGAGIYAANLAVTNSSISFNLLATPSATGGGGVYVGGGDALFDGCDISYNYACSLPTKRQQYGGGIFLNSGRNLTLRNSRMIGNGVVNSNNVWGGAVYSVKHTGSVLIESCLIQSNAISHSNVASTSSGGGLCLSSGAVIRDCEISGNRAGSPTDVVGVGNGGGICFTAADCSNVVESCTIAGNYAKNNGGGVYLPGNGLDEFWNCVVCLNSRAAGDANWYFGDPSRTARVHYTCTPDALAGTANVTGDPQFTDPTAGNYRLRGSSPCMNTGVNRSWMADGTDLDGTPRILYGTVDMGCYEARWQGSVLLVR